MQTVKAIDENQARLGLSLRVGREECRLSLEDAAHMLHIMPNELFEYEHGAKPVPMDILQRLFIMGYKMIEVRIINNRYQVQRNMFKKIESAVAKTSELCTLKSEN